MAAGLFLCATMEGSCSFPLPFCIADAWLAAANQETDLRFLRRGSELIRAAPAAEEPVLLLGRHLLPPPTQVPTPSSQAKPNTKPHAGPVTQDRTRSHQLKHLADRSQLNKGDTRANTTKPNYTPARSRANKIRPKQTGQDQTQ